MKKRSKEKEWEKMSESEKIAYLKKLDSHPNQLKIQTHIAIQSRENFCK